MVLHYAAHTVDARGCGEFKPLGTAVEKPAVHPTPLRRINSRTVRQLAFLTS